MDRHIKRGTDSFMLGPMSKKNSELPMFGPKKTEKFSKLLRDVYRSKK
jgi:hypothetical protein